MSLASLIRYSMKRVKIVSSPSILIRYSTTEITNNVDSSGTKTDMPITMENPFVKEKPQCILCKLKITPDYKNTKLLSQFVSPYTGRVYGRHITRLCKKRQEQVEQEINKSRNAGFMPAYNKEPVFLEDPKLFNPEKPLRNHDLC